MDGLGNTNGKEAASTPEEYKELGDVQYKLKDYRAAIELYTNGIEKASQNPKCASILYNNRAAARMMILQYSLASEDCDRAISLDASNVKAYFRKASALKKSGAFEAAVEAYNKGLLIDPTNSMQLKEKSEADLCLKRMQHAKELIKNSLFPPALHALDAVLQVAPQSMNVKLLKVDALIGCQRYDEAYTLSGGILRHDPSNTKLMQDRAKCLYMMGNLDGALKHLAEAARHDPDGREHIALMRKARGMEATKERGNKAFSAGKMQAAIDAWTEALAIDPMNKLYNAKLHFNCANAFARLKKHKDAVQAATLAIDCDRKYAKAYLRRASSLFALGNVEDLENCIRDYEKVSSMLDEGGKNDVQKELHKAQIALKQAKRKDYYKILGVPRDADEDTIKKAYRKAALKWHPDRQNGREEAEREEAERVFREINDAYSVLSDLPKKKLYDSGVGSEDLDNPHAGHGFGGAGMHSVDPNVLFQMFCQQQRGGGNSDRGFKFG